MKGIAIAIETVVYLILAVTVLTVALGFFLTQAGPAQDQYTLEARRDRYCGGYITQDFGCRGSSGSPVNEDRNQELLKNLRTSCAELARRAGFSYPACSSGSIASLECIQQCCLTCPQRK